MATKPGVFKRVSAYFGIGMLNPDEVEILEKEKLDNPPGFFERVSTGLANGVRSLAGYSTSQEKEANDAQNGKFLNDYHSDALFNVVHRYNDNPMGLGGAYDDSTPKTKENKRKMDILCNVYTKAKILKLDYIHALLSSPYLTTEERNNLITERGKIDREFDPKYDPKTGIINDLDAPSQITNKELNEMWNTIDKRYAARGRNNDNDPAYKLFKNVPDNYQEQQIKLNALKEKEEKKLKPGWTGEAGDSEATRLSNSTEQAVTPANHSPLSVDNSPKVTMPELPNKAEITVKSVAPAEKLSSVSQAQGSLHNFLKATGMNDDNVKQFTTSSPSSSFGDHLVVKKDGLPVLTIEKQAGSEGNYKATFSPMEDSTKTAQIILAGILTSRNIVNKDDPAIKFIKIELKGVSKEVVEAVKNEANKLGLPDGAVTEKRDDSNQRSIDNIASAGESKEAGMEMQNLSIHHH